jgi:hypothetical protein
MKFPFVRYVAALDEIHVHSVKMYNVIVELIPYKLCTKDENGVE